MSTDSSRRDRVPAFTSSRAPTTSTRRSISAPTGDSQIVRLLRPYATAGRGCPGIDRDARHLFNGRAIAMRRRHRADVLNPGASHDEIRSYLRRRATVRSSTRRSSCRAAACD